MWNLIYQSVPDNYLFVEPACGEQDIVVTTLVRCMCMGAGFVRAITSTFKDGFQNNFAQLFSLRSRSAI